MLRPLVAVALLLAAACGRDRVTVGGSVADGEEITSVRVAGDTVGVPIDSGSFLLRRPAADPLVLRFQHGDDSATMTIEGLAPGAALTLAGVWTEDGTAYPTRIALRGARRVTIDRLRMAGDDALPARVDVPATVLAVASEGDALLVRPIGVDLPDLRVVVTPTTRLRTEAGDSIDAGDLAFGDSLRLSGAIQDGYVAATEAAVAPSVAARIARLEEQRRAEGARGDREEARPRHRNFLERLLGIHRGEGERKRKEGKRGKQ
jgi:hypothetical protein